MQRVYIQARRGHSPEQILVPSGTKSKCATYTADVASWNNTRSADKCGANVGNDGTVQIGHDHDIELARFGHQLHGSRWY